MYGFLQRLSNGKRAELEERVHKGLLAAQAAFDKWNHVTWMRPVHILGMLCFEKHRKIVAFAILRTLGYEKEAQEAIEKFEDNMRDLGEDVPGLPEQGDVGVVLIDALNEYMANGELSDMLQRHGFLGDDGRLATQLRRFSTTS